MGASVAGLATWASRGRNVPALTRPIRFRVEPPQGTSLERVIIRQSLALSPAGGRVAMIASGEQGPMIWVQRLDSLTASPLQGTEGAAIVFWSPDVRSWTGRLGVVVGNASYSIYLGSALVMEFGERGLQKLHHVDATGPLGLIALYQTVVVLMVVVSGWGSYQFVEWPLVRKLQGRYAEWTRHEVAAAARLERVPTGS